MISKKVTVKGKVQGVYFRASAKQQALLLGVNGNVCNTDDGCVLLEIEGDEKAVGHMIDWCKHGPALAHVQEIEVDDLEPLNAADFKIKKSFW